MKFFKRLIPLAFYFVGLSVKADQQAFGGQFGGLNNADSSILIGDNESPDLLNVDITDSQAGIKKRKGYEAFNTVASSTHGVNGGYFFRDVSGNDTLVFANNRSVYKSVNSGSFSAFITTDTAGSYYDFTDSLGYLYRATSNRDEFARYDGGTLTYYPSNPAGTQVEVLPDRLVVAGTLSAPNRLYFSKVADFTNFTTGLLEVDPFTTDVGLQGQNITAIKYALGRLIVWTRSTMSFWAGTNQFDQTVQEISTTVGCTQPNSVIYDNSVIYWQAQDGHFWSYDGNEIRRLSDKIASSVRGFSSGNQKSLVESSQGDFTAGTLTFTTATVSSGDVILSTFSQTDTSASDFASGTLSPGVTTNNYTADGRITFSPLLNHSFETGSVNGIPTYWQTLNTFEGISTTTFQSGAQSFEFGCGTNSGFWNITFGFVDVSSAVIVSTAITPSTSWSQFTLTMTGTSGTKGRVKFHTTSGFSSTSNGLYSNYFVSDGSPITFYAIRNADGCSVGGTFSTKADTIDGNIATATGTFVSQLFDTALSTPAWLASSVDADKNGGNITFETQTSSNAVDFNSYVSWSTTTAPSSSRERYIRYRANFTTSSSQTDFQYLKSVQISARSSTGSWVSESELIGSQITSWGPFYANASTDGGAITYSIRTATSVAMLGSASYTGMTSGSQIAASTGSYAQLKAEFSISSATQTPTLNDMTIYWNEGSLVRTFSALDKNHRLLWSLGEGTSTSSTSTYIYDGRFDSWLKYSVPFHAGVLVGDLLYFGNNSSGATYLWPSGEDDNGSAISAYWKSKDFIGGDPGTEKNYNYFSVVADQETGSSMSMDTYINGMTTSTRTYTMSLTGTSGVPYIRYNDRFPNGTVASFISFKFSNSSLNAPFEFYTMKYDYTPKAWRVLP